MTKSTSAAADPRARTTQYLSYEFNPSETNWAALTFPTDVSGLTTKLCKEFRDTIVRCRGSNETFQHVQDTLEVLMAWAQAKLEDDRATNAAAIADADARAALEARQEDFRARVQAGVPIKVTATAFGFVEQSAQNGSILATYDTADDARGPVAAMACMMLAEGRDPNSPLVIHAFGRPGIGSGQTLGQLAGTATGTTTPAPEASGGLIAIRA